MTEDQFKYLKTFAKDTNMQTLAVFIVCLLILIIVIVK